MITVAQLIAAGVAPTQARAFVDPLNIACDRFQINTPVRIAAFLAQCMVESDCLIHTEENLFYTTPENVVRAFGLHIPTPAMAVPYLRDPRRLANFVYANRNGNGDQASGDGYRFIGRGLLQITGREKYAQASNGLAHDYLGSPELVAKPADACLTAAWFWNAHNLNAAADSVDVDGITRTINGKAMLQASRRRQYTHDAMTALTYGPRS